MSVETFQTVGVAFHHMAGRLGAFGRLPESKAELELGAEWLDHCGVNAYTYPIEWNQQAPARFDKLVDALARYDIDIHIGVREVGGGEFRGKSNDPTARICATNSENLAALEQNLKSFLDKGAAGLTYLADDLPAHKREGNDVTFNHCQQCEKRFNGEVSGEHITVLERFVNLYENYDLETQLLFCPPQYNEMDPRYQDSNNPIGSNYSIWPEDPAFQRTQRYFEQLTNYTKDYDYIHYFVTRFEEHILDQYRQLGAKPLAYWANVPRSIEYYRKKLWPDVLPEYEGFDSLFTGWIKNFWTANGRKSLSANPPPNAPAAHSSPNWKEIHSLYEHVDSVWICIHSRQRPSINTCEYPYRLWGLFCDDPDGFEPETASRRVLEEIFGEEAASLIQQQNTLYQSLLLDRVRLAEANGNMEMSARNNAKELLELQESIEEITSERRSKLPLPARRYEEHFKLARDSMVSLLQDLTTQKNSELNDNQK